MQIGPFKGEAIHLHPRQLQRLREIAPFFTPEKIREILLPVATASFDVSLRLLDYCCTNYAKKTRVVIWEKQCALHLFSLYKDWLRHYRRRAFDPFRRRERIYFHHPDGEEGAFETTVAQLNFLRWADMYGVITYVRRNMQAIERDMMRTLVESKKRRHGGPINLKRKRTELSKAPQSKCLVYRLPSNLVGQ